MYRTNRPFNRASNSAAASRSRRLIRATAEALEQRLVLSTFVANTFVDQTDPAGSTTVSLRDAIAAAAAHAGPDTIDVPAGNYPLTQGELEIDDSSGMVTIDAIGGNAVLDAKSMSSVLYLSSGTTVSASDLTITGGMTFNTGVTDEGAGGITNHGTLVLQDSSISGNSGDSGSSAMASGGIANYGTLVLQHSTISANTADLGGGLLNQGSATVSNCAFFNNSTLYQTGHSYGGAILNYDTLTLTSSTLSGNSAASGGALCNYGSGTGTLLAVVSDCTISGNTDGIDNLDGGTVMLANSIVAGNISDDNLTANGPDVNGPINSLGHNLIGDAGKGSSGWVASDLTGTDAHPLNPDLAPLDEFGGPTETQLPLSGSPAIGAGSVGLVPTGVTTDQRGFARVVGGKVDIGAVEIQSASSVAAITPAPAQSAVAGVAAAIKLGSFTDPGGKGPFTVSVRWGDGSPQSVFSLGAAGSLGSETHVFYKTGSLKPTIVVTNAAGGVSQVVGFSVSSVALPAKSFIVNTTADQSDPSSSKTVSLRDAVTRADASNGPATITFDPKVFATAQTISLGSDLDLDGNLVGPITIDGPAAGVTLAGASIAIDAGITAAISRLSITHGNDLENSGTLTLVDSTISGNSAYMESAAAVVGISNYGVMTLVSSTVSGNYGYAANAGIQNNGVMTIDNSAIAYNYSAYGQAGILNNGKLTIANTIVGKGGIDNSGHLSVTDSTITQASGGNLGGNGGIGNSGQMTVVDCTITGNTAGVYGGIYNSGQITVLDCTITGNAGGISNSGTLTLGNSIVAGNTDTGGDVSGKVTSVGHNLIGDASESTGWIPTDLTGTDADPLSPDLSPLGNYGGPTQTLIPLPGSPAIGAGSVALIPAGDTTDQRGFARVVSGKVDIGAVEVQHASVVTVTPPAAQSVVAGVAANIKLGSFADPGGKGPFTVIVNWGDGSPDTTYTLNAAGSLGLQTHTFIEGGPLKATIAVADSSGDVSQLGSFSITSTGASITGIVFNDANGNGTQDNGEAGLAGVVVYADLGNVGYFVTGDPTATTNATGGYRLSGLLPGTYVIRQLSSSGYTQTFPTKRSAGHVTVPAGQTLSGQNFGDELPAATTGVITGTVFNDVNGDGTQDHGETGLAGVLVYADLGDAGHILAGDPSTLTNTAGGYSLSGLAAGSYVIRQVLPTGYVQTTPGSGFGHHVILSASQVISGQDFGDKA